jgi:hypothetical protein
MWIFEPDETVRPSLDTNKCPDITAEAPPIKLDFEIWTAKIQSPQTRSF